jgi:RIP metalloprotease RseP
MGFLDTSLVGLLKCYGGLPFLFVLSIVVFFHELGHFLIARWCGVRVLVFSIGFGPELVGFNDRHGTRWKIAAVPLGGYVKFFGDENAASVPDQAALARMSEAERRESFPHQKVPSRAAIVAAGPIANFLLAIVVFAGIFMFHGKPTATARVDSVQPESAAAAAGFQPGDVVVAIDGRQINTFNECGPRARIHGRARRGAAHAQSGPGLARDQGFSGQCPTPRHSRDHPRHGAGGSERRKA